ncbi:hypothetical protein AHiyo8_05970 [Arthrobacter sp. Hiyo8]|nr:hypothetical protein AHiyo8_05970 [Arthrobacter sp. Hiyo8]
MVEHASLFLGKHNNATGTVRKSLKHFATLLAAAYLDATSLRAFVGIAGRRILDNGPAACMALPRGRSRP